MESKTLTTIQKVFNVGRILAKIAYVFSIIGAITCLVGGVIMIATDSASFEIGGVTIHAIMNKNASVNFGTALASLVAGFIICGGEVFVAKKVITYFENERATGTPFTYDGADELKKVGIFQIWFPIVMLAVAAIAVAIVKLIYPETTELDISGAVNIGTGLFFIIISLLCKYGAEVSEKSTSNEVVTTEDITE